jgi:YD repeat-containing protein
MKRILFALAVTTIGLVSCQKDMDVKPIILQAAPSGARPSPTDGVIASAVQKRLLSEGNVKLSYSADGRLTKYDAGSYQIDLMYLSASAADLYPGYKPAKGIKLQGYYNGAMTKWAWYVLLDDKGVCQRAVAITDGKKQYFDYAYNGKGQLISVSESATNNAWLFEYDDQDRLSRVHVYRNGKHEEETLLSYKFPNGSYLPNKLRQYPDVNILGLHYFRYLPIYGKSTDHLVRRLITTEVATRATVLDNTYAYTLDGDDYITTKTVTNLLANTSWPVPHTYEVINYGVEQ